MSREPIWTRPEPRGGLSRVQIVDVALEIADAEGLEAVSMRRLARELGSGAMSLYHYVENRDELLDLMADRVAEGMLVPAAVPEDWRAALKAVAQRSHDTFRRHPWMLGALNERPRVSPNLLRHIEQSAQAVAGLGEQGVEPALLNAIVLAVDDYTIGFTVREVAGVGATERGQTMRELAEEPYIRYLLESGEFPMLTRFVAAGGELPPRRDFQEGLDWLLDGFAARIGR